MAGMGFGSYDESEQDDGPVATDIDDEGQVGTNSTGHDGEVEFEFTTSNDELLDRLETIKER